MLSIQDQIYESDTDDIINRYIVFSKIYDEQRKLYGSTKEAVTGTIRICKSRNVLKEYLESREQASLKEEALTMFRLKKINLSEVKKCFLQLSDETIEEVKAEAMQLA